MYTYLHFTASTNEIFMNITTYLISSGFQIFAYINLNIFLLKLDIMSKYTACVLASIDFRSTTDQDLNAHLLVESLVVCPISARNVVHLYS